MSQNWITQQERELLEETISGSKHAILACTKDGQIVFCNRAFESVLGWSLLELVDRKRSWMELTVNPDPTDDLLVQEVLHGVRMDYAFRKAFRHKNNTVSPGVINVRRYPRFGDQDTFEVFLVDFIPDQNADNEIARLAVDAINNHTEEISVMRETIQEIVGPARTFNRLVSWGESHPRLAGVVLLLGGGVIFGDSAWEVYDRFVAVFRP